MDFDSRYSKLNTAQKEAVDVIDGPVMVIAGPGTGKTELLSMRVANILKQTDTLPENILCLTFTDSGANAMRERLTDIIGRDAYRVAVHTFHSFGTEIINQNGQYFYQGANFRPADELSSYEIMRSIFDELSRSNPLASKNNGEYTHLSDAVKVISELKASGLTSDELLSVLDKNDVVIEKTEQLLSPIFAGGINKAIGKQLAAHIDTIRKCGDIIPLADVVSLAQVLTDSLEKALNDMESLGKTTPITAWRNAWFKKDQKGDFILKSHERQVKLRAISFVYERYLTKMQESELYDYDDMILRVVHAMEVFNDLRYNLQEKFQYIIVDEFQDTNLAQMRIIHNLTNNDIQGDTPNVMVVGDDDQAIYSFQGADSSNIINFRKNYPRTKLIVLTDNYRSVDNILSESRAVIIQGSDRLENNITGLDKQLSAQHHNGSGVKLYEAATSSDERYWLVNKINDQINSGVSPGDIAVLTRRHNEIAKLLPYFAHANINVSYERRDNVLDQEPIKLIEKLARLLVNLSIGRHDEVNSALPEILAHPAWNLKPDLIWKLSLKAHNQHSHWLEIMSTIPEFIPIHEWLISAAALATHAPLEKILDIIIGKTKLTPDTKFISPLYNYFFGESQLAQNPDIYLTHLEALRTIRTKLREYRPGQIPTIETFVDFIDLNRRIGATISSIRHATNSGDSVNLMTAHKSKGLEFGTVYIINAVDSVWGKRARAHNRLINYPENLPLTPAGETDDERLRLFYVAMTRAKNELYISYSLNDDRGKANMRAVFLVDSHLTTENIKEPDTVSRAVENAEMEWYRPLFQPADNNLRSLLAPTLENYQLSVTHLQNFLDITRGGPTAFLMQNLLRFPQEKSPSASYGTAIHSALQEAHTHYQSTQKKQAIEDIIANFEKALHDQHLDETDFKHYLEKGSDSLQRFLENDYGNFTQSQRTELNFSSQHSIVGNAHLTGKLDLVDIDQINKTMVVTDYKTGKPSTSWSGHSEYEKIKLHKYQQQLMFYKLLVEKSRDFHTLTVTGGSLKFVEPTVSGELVTLSTDFSDMDFERFVTLINAVWKKIKNLDMPDITEYEPSLNGIRAFEQALIDNSVDS